MKTRFHMQFFLFPSALLKVLRPVFRRLRGRASAQRSGVHSGSFQGPDNYVLDLRDSGIVRDVVLYSRLEVDSDLPFAPQPRMFGNIFCFHRRGARFGGGPGGNLTPAAVFPLVVADVVFDLYFAFHCFDQPVAVIDPRVRTAASNRHFS